MDDMHCQIFNIVLDITKWSSAAINRGIGEQLVLNNKLNPSGVLAVPGWLME